MLTTAFYMVADASTGVIRYANAGHPKPLLLHRTEDKVEQLANVSPRSHPALGLFEGAVYENAESHLHPEDLLLLFTDGLYEVEGANDQIYTTEMLSEALRKHAKLPAAELLDQLLFEVKEFGLGKEFADDVCVVGLEVGKPKS